MTDTNPRTSAVPTESTTTTTRQVMASYLEALSAGDLGCIRSHFADDATWTIHGTLPLAGTYRGADQIMTFLATAMGQLFAPGTQQFSFGDLVASGATAVLEWRVTGTGTATGRRYDNQYCGIFVIRQGRIDTVREYFDTDHVRRVLYK